MESFKCVLPVVVLLCCLLSYGVARPEPTLEELDGLLKETAQIESAFQDYNCDCFVRLNVETAKAEWYCSSSSDYECQSIQLEELQDIVQTQEETKEWTNKRMKLLAQDMSTDKQCVCSVKINKEDASVQYYCNGLSCYMLAAEVSPKRKAVIAAAVPQSKYPCKIINPSDPCCRCIYGRRRAVCSDSHCHVLPCPITKQIKVEGECCPVCTDIPEAVQSVHHQSAHNDHLVWVAKSSDSNEQGETSSRQSATKQTAAENHATWIAKSSNDALPPDTPPPPKAQATSDQSISKQSTSKEHQPWIAKSSNDEYKAAKIQGSDVKEQTSDPHYCTTGGDPCCKCIQGIRLCMEPDEICPRLPCPNPVRVYGQCCPVCAYTAEDMSSQPAKASSCPYYSDSAAVVNAFTECGCEASCLSQKQDECEARARSSAKYYIH